MWSNTDKGQLKDVIKYWKRLTERCDQIQITRKMWSNTENG